MAVSGSMTVTALEGETVDALVFRVLGKGAEAVERVLEANPNLADLGLFLPLGQPVKLPAIASAPAARPLIQLWS